MAEQKSKKAGEIQATVKTNGDEKINFEPIKQIESDTFESVKGIKTLDYIIIALLIYLVFMLLPDIQEKVEWVEKDLNSVLVQSERFKKSTRVFAKDNACATCHLDPDHLLHNLQSKYPSFSDIKSFMRVGHQRYWTNLTPIPDDELIEVYRTIK